ncbi:hypothetical protein ACSS6W_002541 [Trichoderma asperelloides]
MDTSHYICEFTDCLVSYAGTSCGWDIFVSLPLLGIAHEARHAAAVPAVQPLARKNPLLK